MPVTRKKRIFKGKAAAAAKTDDDATDLSLNETNEDDGAAGDNVDEETEEKKDDAAVEKTEETKKEIPGNSVTINLELTEVEKPEPEKTEELIPEVKVVTVDVTVDDAKDTTVEEKEVTSDGGDKKGDKIADKKAEAMDQDSAPEAIVEAGKEEEETTETEAKDGDSGDAAPEDMDQDVPEEEKAGKSSEEKMEVKAENDATPGKETDDAAVKDKDDGASLAKKEKDASQDKDTDASQDKKDDAKEDESAMTVKEEVEEAEMQVKQEDDVTIIEEEEEDKPEDKPEDQPVPVAQSKPAETKAAAEDDDCIIVETEDDDDKPIPVPESFAKLHQLTVNIGPIKQRDLMSKELHNILNLTWNFEIKFEKKESVEEGITKSERPGYVRIPFLVKSPKFLVTIAKKLGNLRIDGRDMSVKFPEAFNAAVKDCEAYMVKMNERTARQRTKRVEQLKRQISVRNVPEKVEEDTIRSLFPEASGVTMNTVTAEDGTKTVRSVLLDFETEKACLEFLRTNKDVQIGDCKVRLARTWVDNLKGKNTPANQNTNFGGKRPFVNNRGAFRGRGGVISRGGRGGMPAFKEGQFKAFGRGQTGQGQGRGGGAGGRGIMGAGPKNIPSPTAARGGGVGRARGMARGNQGGSFRGKQGQSPGASRSPGAQGRGLQSPQAGNRSMQSPSSNQGRQMQSPSRSQHGRPSMSPQQQGQGRMNQGRGSYQGNRQQGQQRAQVKPYAARGSGSQQYERQANQAFTKRDQHTGGRSQQNQGGSMQQASGSRGGMSSGAGEEDPIAMMAYLKSTLARMEEKITQRSDYGGANQDTFVGGGTDTRKRKAARSDQYGAAKRQFTRFTDAADTSYDTGYNNTQRTATRSYDDYDDRSTQRGFSDTTSGYQDNYRDTGRYDNTRQTQNFGGNQKSVGGATRNFGGATRNFGGAQRGMGVQGNLGGQGGIGGQGSMGGQRNVGQANQMGFGNNRGTTNYTSGYGGTSSYSGASASYSGANKW